VTPSQPLALGTHVFTLVVVDGAGNTSLPASLAVEVVDESRPTPRITAPSTVAFRQRFTLDGLRSTDVGGSGIVEYRWSGAVGPTVTTVPVLDVEVEPSEPLALGAHVFTLVVVDGAGNVSAPASATVEVVDAMAPTAVIHGPANVAFGDPFTLDGGRSTDVGGSGIVEYRWGGAAGSTVTTAPVLGSVDSTPSCPPAEELEHDFVEPLGPIDVRQVRRVVEYLELRADQDPVHRYPRFERHRSVVPPPDNERRDLETRERVDLTIQRVEEVLPEDSKHRPRAPLDLLMPTQNLEVLVGEEVGVMDPVVEQVLSPNQICVQTHQELRDHRQHEEPTAEGKAPRNADRIDQLVPYLGKNVMYTLATPLLLGIGFMIA